jgi:copper chaperone CopZ
MEKVIIDVPSMYADHHVLTVRKVLTALDGIQEVYASSAFGQVLVKYDPERVQAETITKALTDAGYTQALEMPVQDKVAEDVWKFGNSRRTSTYPADVAMSGEFRKY